MPEESNGGLTYQIVVPDVVARMIEALHRKAAFEGRGHSMLSALKTIVQQLQRHPNEIGEPLYTLRAMNLQVRTTAIRPVAVDYGVHELLQIVFIRSVSLFRDEQSS